MTKTLTAYAARHGADLIAGAFFAFAAIWTLIPLPGDMGMFAAGFNTCAGITIMTIKGIADIVNRPLARQVQSLQTHVDALRHRAQHDRQRMLRLLHHIGRRRDAPPGGVTRRNVRRGVGAGQ